MGNPGGKPGGKCPFAPLGSPIRPAAAPKNGKPGNPNSECTGLATEVGGAGGAGGAMEVLKG